MIVPFRFRHMVRVVVRMFPGLRHWRILAIGILIVGYVAHTGMQGREAGILLMLALIMIILPLVMEE